MQYIPSKKQIPSWMRMNDNSSRHWMTSYDVDMEVTSAQDIESCRRDYVQGKCNAIADANPELKLRNYLCKYLTDQGNGGRAPYCTMSGDSTSVYPEYMPCVNSDGTTDLSKPECKLACSENKNQLGCSTKFTSEQINLSKMTPDQRAKYIADAAAKATADAAAKATADAAAKAAADKAAADKAAADEAAADAAAKAAAAKATADAAAKAAADKAAADKAAADEAAADAAAKAAADKAAADEAAADAAVKAEQADAARTKCIELDFWTGEDPGCEINARREPELKLRERMCQHMTNEGGANSNEWCGMYDKNEMIFPEFADCLTPEGKMNTKCKLMCNGRPSQKGCEWYAEAKKIEDIKFAKEQCGSIDENGLVSSVWNEKCSDIAFTNPELKIRQRMCTNIDLNTMNGLQDSGCNMTNVVFDRWNHKEVYPEYARCYNTSDDSPECRLACTKYPNQKGCDKLNEKLKAEAAVKAEADAKPENFCRTDYFELINGQYKPEKCNAFADANPTLKLRSTNCKRLTDQRNGGRGPYCLMSQDGILYPEYIPSCDIKQ